MKITLLGTGLMGSSIAKRLHDSGFEVCAYNRTVTKLQDLQKLGVRTTTAADEAIAASDYIVLTLSDAAAIEGVLFDELVSSLNGKTVIQMGTIAPEESKELAIKIETSNGRYIEAPVLGSIPQAKTGTLLVMVGGDAELYRHCLPILQVLGEEPMYIGKAGSAAALKLALNQLIASLTAGFSLSLGLIRREGVSVGQFMDILRESALYAPTFDKKLSRMDERNFDDPNFPTKHLLKDTDLFLKAASQRGLNTDGLLGIREIIQKAIAANLADCDYSSIYNVIDPEAER